MGSRSTSHSRQHPILSHLHHECDILDHGSLISLLEKLGPDLIIHMAAQAFNGASWGSEDYTHQANSTGTLNLLNAVRQECPDAKVLLACSSAEYGDVQPEDCPLVEDRLLRPITPYGVSKASCEALGYQYYSNFRMQVFLPRLFIHVGTGHPPATAIQNFARQVAQIKVGELDPVMKVGRLDTARDFIDVRDGVEGMLLLMKRASRAGSQYL